MTAVDRAFIKAYTSRRLVRGISADTAEQRAAKPGEMTLGHGTTSYRVDGAHLSAAHSAGPHTKPTSRKPRRPSAENDEQASASRVVAVTDGAGRGERVVVSLSDSAVMPDWIWQREPHPVFCDEASTAAPSQTAPAAKPPSSQAPSSKPQSPKQSSSKVLSPAILSLASPSGGVLATVGLAASAPLQNDSVTATEPVSGPLSSFTLVPRLEDRLQPALEVDQFLWPAEVVELGDAAAVALDGFATHLIAGAGRGQRRIALVGVTPAAGATTAILCLARLARLKGATWGLLDANFDHAALAPQLGIAQTAGWQAVLSGRERLADVSIASLDDHLILVPLAADGVPLDALAANFRAPVLFSMLADIVDLVLVDAGSVEAGPVEAQHIDRLAALVRAARVDAVYLVYDERSTAPDDLVASGSRLRAAGVSVVGAIANFAAF